MRLTDCHNVMDFRQLARRRLPRPVFDYIDGGADDEVSLARSTEAFDECDLVPDVLSGVADPDLSVTVMGKLTSECTQLFEAVVQCVRPVVSLVDESAMLKRGKRTVDGTSVDVGAACEFGRGPRGVEEVAHTEGSP